MFVTNHMRVYLSYKHLFLDYNSQATRNPPPPLTQPNSSEPSTTEKNG